MIRKFSDRPPKVLPACNFFSQCYFYNIFFQTSCRFCLQTLTKFEAAKTGSGVEFLRLTAVWLLCRFHFKIKGLLETTNVCFIVEIFLLERLQTVYSHVSCDLVTFRIVTSLYLLCNDLSRVVLFVQTGSVEVLVFP